MNQFSRAQRRVPTVIIQHNGQERNSVTSRYPVYRGRDCEQERPVSNDGSNKFSRARLTVIEAQLRPQCRTTKPPDLSISELVWFNRVREVMWVAYVRLHQSCKYSLALRGVTGSQPSRFVLLLPASRRNLLA